VYPESNFLGLGFNYIINVLPDVHQQVTLSVGREEMGSRGQKVPSTPLCACSTCSITFCRLSGVLYSTCLVPAMAGIAWEFTARIFAGSLIGFKMREVPRYPGSWAGALEALGPRAAML